MSLSFARHTIPVSLRRLFPSASFVGCADVVTAGATEHSAHCRPGCVFAAIPGARHRGAEFIPEAIERGAAAILLDRPLAALPVPQCVVPNVRRSFAELCHALHGYPSRRLGVVGVTGTNGKTTTTWLMRSLWETAGHPSGLLGTIEYSNGIDRIDADLTTPDSGAIAEWLGATVNCGTRFAAVELSSHALAQDRCAGTQLDVAVVTNITHDHLDYHGDLDAYARAKFRIVDMLKRGGLLLLNADDPLAATFAEQAPAHVQVATFAIDQPSDIQARVLNQSRLGAVFEVTAGAVRHEIESSLIGRHNVLNCLAALGAGIHFGLSIEDAAEALAAVGPVPGRLEPVDCGQDFGVFVDYAHTPDAIGRAIETLQEITTGRLICVIGAGGDRDRTKRPLMGRAASAADVLVVTSDNPRGERPEDIIEDICRGVDPTRAVHVEADREHAIEWALAHACDGDCVLVAGKGHERFQIIGDQRVPFDDRLVCRRRLAHDGPVQTAEPSRIGA